VLSFVICLMQKPDRLGALLRNHRVFPDANLGMEDPSGILEGAPDFAAKIPHADMAVPDLRHGQLHAMNAT
jgi:hypothetical protein